MFTYAQLRLLARACGALLLWFAISAPVTAQTNHLVHIGLGGFQLAFTDADSGTNITVVRPGDTVTWEWDYLGIDHSTTSGTCDPVSPFAVCRPDGTWDSGLRFNPPPPPTFTRQFNNLGVFPYFCQIHGPAFGMRARVVVLNAPDYELDINNNSNAFQPPPIPTITTLAGQNVNFNGTLLGFLGYNNLVNLSCQGGSPRNPDNCPAQSATPSPQGTPFNFSVGASTAGDYTFNITGTGTDVASITHSQQVQLNVTDVILTTPSPNVVTTIAGQNSPPVAFQVMGLNLHDFSTGTGLSCSGLPTGASCNFNQAFPFISPSFPVQNISLNIFTGSAPAGIYPLQIVLTSTFAGNIFNRSQNITLRLLPADHLNMQVLPSTNVTAGTPFNVVVTAADEANNPVQNYMDTIHFTSSDQSISASLPSDYTFTGQGNDNGTHSFPVTLTKIEPVTITTTDTLFSTVTGTSPIIRVQNGFPNVTVTVVSSRAGMAPPHFSVAHPQDAAVTFTTTVSALSGSTSPDGDVRLFDGTKDLGTAPLNASTPGVATASFVMDGVLHPLLSVGGHSITAVYEPGDGSSFTGDLSPSISQPRSPAPRCDSTRCP
ncbi:MAG TPA: hypothetical protein VK699_02330 [Terriglobales bacterium]|jgi:plastocyanin|nr:hypothetical protein [Terriglobales bacterium]